MIRARLWQEHTHRSITTSEGPLVVPPGKFVLVAVCDTATEVARVVALLDDRPLDKEERKDE